MNTLGDVVVAKQKRKRSSKGLGKIRGTATRPIVKKIRAAGIRQPHHKGYLV